MKTKKVLALHLSTLILVSTICTSTPQKQWRVHPLWTRRNQEGAYTTLVKALQCEDPLYFKKYLRMSPADCKLLKSLVRPYLKKFPSGRKALSVGHRLAITLRYLASGDSLASISFSFRIGFSTAHYVVKETCIAIWKALQPQYLPIPNQQMWENIEKGFRNVWQFPNCIGAVDGKHIKIQSPAHSGTVYFNYKHHFSTVLMAVVDSAYKFIIVDVGAYGSNSDGGIWKNFSFGRDFNNERVPIPPCKSLPGTSESLPHVLLGDEAFQLTKNFLRPFPGKQLNNPRRIFNYRLSRARRCSENAFGILTNRWRIFMRPINMKPENVDWIVKATTALHNFLKTEGEIQGTSVYCPTSYEDRVLPNGEIVPGDWRQEFSTMGAFGDVNSTPSRHHSREAEMIREKFSNYFTTIGAVPWQYERAGLMNNDDE